MTSNSMAASAALTSHGLSQIELDTASMYLAQTELLITGALRNISEPQWKFKPGSDRWSIAEIVEHVIAVQEHVLGPLREQLDNAPVTPIHPDREHMDAMIIYRIPGRLIKAQSPFQPGVDLSRSQAMERLSANYAGLKQRLETTPDLRNRSIESAPMKIISNGMYSSMDGYQWILAAAAHTERHTKQVLEVMADSRYPA